MVGTSLENPCPKCGGFAHIPSADRGLVCARCNQPISPLVQHTLKTAEFTKRTPLRVGMKAMLGGKAFYAVGRLSIEKTRLGQDAQWQEWVLLTPEGDLRYLQTDGSSWTLWEPFSPADEPIVDTLHKAQPGDQFPFEEGVATATDAGPCHIAGYEGELPWRIGPEEMVTFARLKSGDQVFYAKVPDIGHPAWLRGRQLKQQEVLAFFGLQTAARTVYRKRATAEGLQFLAVCCLLAAIIAGAFDRYSDRIGVSVASGSAPVNVVAAQGAWMGPYDLSSGNRVYLLRVWTDLNSPDGWVAATLNQHAPANPYSSVAPAAVGPIGSPVVRAQSVFRVASAGSYYVHLASSPEPAESTAQIRFEIKQSVLYPNYLLSFCIVFGICGIALLVLAYLPR